MPRTIVMSDPHTVAFACLGPDGPVRVDVALTVHPLDDDDPFRVGDTLVWAATGGPTTPEEAEDIGRVLGLAARVVIGGIRAGRGGAA
jgi:hypothetical protein